MGAVPFRPIQPVGGCCPQLADSTSEVGVRGGGGGGGAEVLSTFGRFNQWAVDAVRFQPVQPVGGAHVWKLLLHGWEG